MPELHYQRPLTGIHKFNLFAGVIMPAISISVEATSHICAETFFDPIPSMWFLLLVIFVPIAQLNVWFAIRRGKTERLARAGWLNAFALGVSIYYSFLYIPLLPLAALTLFFLIGLLPLAPMLSLVAAIVMRHQLKQLASAAPQKSFPLTKTGLLGGLAITAVLIGLLDLPATLTRYGLRMAASDSVVTRTAGIQFLRTWGSKEHLLRACYNRAGVATEFFGYAWTVQNPITPAEAQKIYYRVTGETFDTSVPPHRSGGRLVPQDEIDFDSDQGGVTIAGKLRGLSLASSQIDASADANGGVGYMQWTLVFRNESRQSREARAEVQLPPGGVVSRLTLWVNGEEREAAFAGRGKVREAYQQVAIRQRRDPVLVTTAGRDRILVQCFPVLPNNGEMKIRLGITVPLIPEYENKVRLLFPHFVNRNFRIPDHVNHSTWVDSKTPMNSESQALKQLANRVRFSLWGSISESDLSNPKNSIILNRSNVPVWSKDPFASKGFIIEQTIEAHMPVHLYRVILVVDTSTAMVNSRDEIREAIRSIPPHFDIKLVFANADEAPHVIASGIDEISTRLNCATFSGGADNAAALVKAWDLAAEKPGNNAIVWVHGPQLLQLSSVEELSRRWERSPYGPKLYSVSTTSGLDQVEKKLDGIHEVNSVARTGRLQEDLEKLFTQLTGQATTLTWVRTSKKVETDPDPNEAIETSDHLARLWANDEVTRILAARDPSLQQAATMLAVQYQLVTPVSGAVVLETAEQYRAAGLTPVDAGTVPTIPEPEMVALLAVAGVFLIWLIYRKRRTRGGCTA